ncbi:MAG: heme biosynthesis protein HemY, partial [Caulobacterales bacterium]
DGKAGRAAAVLESAWKAAPHPALWLAYRDLVTSETPRERTERLMLLAAQNPAHRESRILEVERALIVGDAGEARRALARLEAEPLTARIAGLRARAAFASGQPDEARLWLAQGMNAPQEPDWSDLDPAARAFAYPPADWARLVIAFAETGELIHPRHERGERTLSELPELPIAYADSAPFLAADGAGGDVGPGPYPLDEAGYEEDDPVAEADEPEAPRGRARRSRLASAPRAAK